MSMMEDYLVNMPWGFLKKAGGAVVDTAFPPVPQAMMSRQVQVPGQPAQEGTPLDMAGMGPAPNAPGINAAWFGASPGSPEVPPTTRTEQTPMGPPTSWIDRAIPLLSAAGGFLSNPDVPFGGALQGLVQGRQAQVAQANLYYKASAEHQMKQQDAQMQSKASADTRTQQVASIEELLKTTTDPKARQRLLAVQKGLQGNMKASDAIKISEQAFGSEKQDTAVQMLMDRLSSAERQTTQKQDTAVQMLMDRLSSAERQTTQRVGAQEYGIDTRARTAKENILAASDRLNSSLAQKREEVEKKIAGAVTLQEKEAASKEKLLLDKEEREGARRLNQAEALRGSTEELTGKDAERRDVIVSALAYGASIEDATKASRMLFGDAAGDEKSGQFYAGLSEKYYRTDKTIEAKNAQIASEMQLKRDLAQQKIDAAKSADERQAALKEKALVDAEERKRLSAMKQAEAIRASTKELTGRDAERRDAYVAAISNGATAKAAAEATRILMGDNAQDTKTAQFYDGLKSKWDISSQHEAGATARVEKQQEGATTRTGMIVDQRYEAVRSNREVAMTRLAAATDENELNRGFKERMQQNTIEAQASRQQADLVAKRYNFTETQKLDWAKFNDATRENGLKREQQLLMQYNTIQSQADRQQAELAEKRLNFTETQKLDWAKYDETVRNNRERNTAAIAKARNSATEALEQSRLKELQSTEAKVARAQTSLTTELSKPEPNQARVKMLQDVIAFAGTGMTPPKPGKPPPLIGTMADKRFFYPTGAPASGKDLELTAEQAVKDRHLVALSPKETDAFRTTQNALLMVTNIRKALEAAARHQGVVMKGGSIASIKEGIRIQWKKFIKDPNVRYLESQAPTIVTLMRALGEKGVRNKEAYEGVTNLFMSGKTDYRTIYKQLMQIDGELRSNCPVQVIQAMEDFRANPGAYSPAEVQQKLAAQGPLVINGITITPE